MTNPFPNSPLRVAKYLAGIALSYALAFAAPALAADLPVQQLPVFLEPVSATTLKPFYVRLGALGLFSDQGLAPTVAGVPVANAGAMTAPVVTAYADVTYFLKPWIAVSIAAGIPPVLTEKGTGVFTAFGTLAQARAGAAVASVHYHADFGRLHPYVGGGVAYAMVFHNTAGAIAFPLLRNAFAPALVMGADVDITEHWTVFVDIRKIWLQQRLTGIVAPFPGGPKIFPTSTRVRSDFTLATAGLGYRF